MQFEREAVRRATKARLFESRLIRWACISGFGRGRGSRPKRGRWQARFLAAAIVPNVPYLH